MTEIESAEQFNELLAQDESDFIILFYAPYADPSMALWLEAKEFTEMPLYACNIVEFPVQASILNVKGVPMLVRILNGEVARWQVGYKPEETFNAFFQRD